MAKGLARETTRLHKAETGVQGLHEADTVLSKNEDQDKKGDDNS